MAGGAAATGPGIGANAPRNVWAGVLSVRFHGLPACTHGDLTITHLVDLLRRLWWYPLRL